MSKLFDMDLFGCLLLGNLVKGRKVVFHGSGYLQLFYIITLLTKIFIYK